VSESAPSDESTAGNSTRNRHLLIALIAGVTGIVALFLYMPSEGLAWAVTVEQLLAHPQDFAARTLNLQGNLVSGSMLYRKSPCEYRFRIGDAKGDVEVRYAACVLPDTVRDLKGEKVEISATGKLAHEGHFQANLVQGKCPGHYDDKDKQSRPQLIEPKAID